jgi:hypothetical protein
MALYAMIYTALPASTTTQWRQALLGSGLGSIWWAALYYFLPFAVVSGICFFFSSRVRMVRQRPGFWSVVLLALGAALLVLAALASFVQITFGGYQCEIAGGGRVSIWELLVWPFVASEEDLAGRFNACFTLYSTLDLIILTLATFITVLGLGWRRSKEA